MEHKSNPLADKARSYTVSPREDAWDKIHDRLQKKKTPQRKKLDVTIIIIIAAAVLGIAIIIGLLQIMHMVDHNK